jgi:type II secretory pathway pseudopilin PulG
LKRRLARLVSDESGYNLVELITTMGILGIVMTSLTTVLVSATNADVRMNQNFQAQTQARTALERFRREGHAACRADPAGPTTTITLTFITSGSCPASGGRQVNYQTTSQERPKIAINLPVNPYPNSGRGTYTLDDNVVLRNASRTA